MGILLENVYDLLIKPRAALREICANRSIMQALWIQIGSVLLFSLGLSAGMLDGATLILAVIIQLAGSVVFWLLSGAVWHLLAEFMGGKGSAKRLLTATGFIHFVQILIVPFCLLALAAGESGAALIGMVNVVIWLWMIVLEVLAIAVNYELSLLRSALVWALPLLAVLAVIVVIAVIAGSLLASAMSQLMIESL